MDRPLTEKISHVLYRKRLKTARQRKRAVRKLQEGKSDHGESFARTGHDV